MKNEADTQNRLRVMASQANGFLWRNNSGAFEAQPGRWVRYGLANDSAQVNKDFKSLDLIGLTPRMITQVDIGRVFGIFTAIEAKPPGWHLVPSDKRGFAQLEFINTVLKAGGYAGFATHPEHFKELTK